LVDIRTRLHMTSMSSRDFNIAHQVVSLCSICSTTTTTTIAAIVDHTQQRD
jgi:hypothetical protein